MSGLIASNKKPLIVGVGASGVSVARFLQSQGQLFYFADEKVGDHTAQRIADEFPGVHIETGPLCFENWSDTTQIILSPGVPRANPAIQAALSSGIEVIGDIELFARHVKAPVVAITGSNGKTTVTSIVAEMAKKSGVKVAVGGNIGTPALDLLDDSVELYVLELSSFQLESTESLKADVATVLNISPDHLDRYANLHEYFLCKQKIFHRAKKIVVNRDDVFTQPPVADRVQVVKFGQSSPDLKDFGLINDQGYWLLQGLQRLIHESDLKLRGKHNLLNSLAALAIGQLCDFPMTVMLDVLRAFPGLPHRCQWVASHNGVEYINDSKGTNIGSTEAALSGLANDKNIVLIAGGDGKGADFSVLRSALNANVKHLILFGRDASVIADASQKACDIDVVANMEEAVILAHSLAIRGDVVLLSPACASQDMFENYQDRGNQFIKIVEGLCRP